MTQTTALPVVKIASGRHKRAKAGHPWVYSNEVEMDAAAKALPPGSLVRLEAASGEMLGVAHFNARTLIAARLLSRGAAMLAAESFIAARLAAALALRERLYPGGYYRLIHAEADGLPGLIVDRCGDVAIVQANTAGMDRLVDTIVAVLQAALAPRAIVLRNDSPARVLEGLPLDVRVVAGTVDAAVEIVENGGRFLADVATGQKTGWFFDQRENRAAVAAVAVGARLLDVYSYAGGFALTAARAGAASVVAVDRSEAALALAERAAALNGLTEKCQFVRNEAFAELERLGASGARFDVVVADPPAFVKSKKDLAAGARGYRKLARLAARLVSPGGFLFIASCSHNVDRALFAEEVSRGLDDAARTGRILRDSGAAADHPVHPHLPESAYLKAQLLQLD